MKLTRRRLLHCLPFAPAGITIAPKIPLRTNQIVSLSTRGPWIDSKSLSAEEIARIYKFSARIITDVR